MMTHAGAAAVAGIGVDLLRLDRIERVFARHGERFVRRILGPQEIEKSNSRSRRDPQRGLRSLATRFAANEAFSKAIDRKSVVEGKIVQVREDLVGSRIIKTKILPLYQ